MSENSYLVDSNQKEPKTFTAASFLKEESNESQIKNDTEIQLDSPGDNSPDQSDSQPDSSDNDSLASELLAGACVSKSDRSPYLVQRLIETNERNLFNHVKFNLVKREIDRLGLAEPGVVDIGCGLQVAHTYLSSLNLKCKYFGIDYEPNFHPDAVVDLLNSKECYPEFPWEPDVLLMLDVLEHLHEDIDELGKIVKNISSLTPIGSTIIFTLPQMYRLDRFKLPHLHYPEHKIRLTQKEWSTLIGEHFTIRSVSGFGYLSVIPYLPMLSKSYQPDNRLGKMFSYMRNDLFEWSPLKPVDLVLSQMLGRIPWVNSFANDIMIIATPKRH